VDIFHNLILGFQVASSWENILFCFIGVLIGTLIGVLPGIGPTTGIAILIPVTFGMSATTAIITLAGIYYGRCTGIDNIDPDQPARESCPVMTSC
jgi:putative tricarboxylic transport membrane protein